MLNNLLLGQTAEEKLYVEDVFQTYLYSGTGSSQTITTGVDLSANSGMVWIKGRSGATDHAIYDTARGVQKDLVTNSTAAQTTQSTGITAFSSTGFTIGALAKLNTSAATYASWTFRKSAKFFDCVTWTGNGANRTISHALGVVPGLIIVKRTDTTGDWQVYHRSLANTEYLVLNTTAAKATGTTRWNSTTPTATEFSLGTDATVNASGGSYVAYLFAHDTTADGVIQCGSYTGDGSTTQGPFINLSWEPQLVLVKRASGINNWHMFDNMRGLPTGVGDLYLRANVTTAEGGSTTNSIDVAATGFYPVDNGATDTNNSGGTYIYLAIRRGPMRTPTDATKVFSPITRTGTRTALTTSSGITNDTVFIIERPKTYSGTTLVFDRLRGPNKELASNSMSQEGSFNLTTTVLGFDAQSGIRLGTDSDGFVNYNTTSSAYIDYNFRRAPGFFDVVCYTGTGSARTVSHNLGVAPELMIVKNRDSGMEGWRVQTAYSRYGYSGLIALQSSGADYNASNYFTTPTATTFGIGTSNPNDGGHNKSGNRFVSYLFASCPGVSKVGSYTGTGTTKQIDCGFTNGARFVLIKRTDSTGDWTVWDTARGIVSGNDPYLLLNSTAAEVTNTDYIDPLSTGFEISSTAPAAINANGGTFVFLAIA